MAKKSFRHTFAMPFSKEVGPRKEYCGDLIVTATFYRNDYYDADDRDRFSADLERVLFVGCEDWIAREDVLEFIKFQYRIGMTDLHDLITDQCIGMAMTKWADLSGDTEENDRLPVDDAQGADIH